MVAAGEASRSAQLSYAKGYYGSTDPALDAKLKNAQANASSFAGAAASSFASISKRFKATIAGQRFYDVMTTFRRTTNGKKFWCNYCK